MAWCTHTGANRVLFVTFFITRNLIPGDSQLYDPGTLHLLSILPKISLCIQIPRVISANPLFQPVRIRLNHPIGILAEGTDGRFASREGVNATLVDLPRSVQSLLVRQTFTVHEDRDRV